MSKQSNGRPVTAAAAIRGEEGSLTVPKLNFPFKLHRFITETGAGKATKQVAGWSEQGDQFFINYNDPELLSRIMVPYFRHGNYASLRRQMNHYGFLKKGGFWRRKITTAGNLFHRDRPQDIAKIKPRHPTKTRPLKKKKDPPAASDTSASKDAIEKAGSPAKKDPPEAALQALYCFLEVCSASHPDLIGWNSTGTAFYMEVFDAEVQTLLKTYFPAMKKEPMHLLKAYGFSRDRDGNFYHAAFSREKFAGSKPVNTGSGETSRNSSVAALPKEGSGTSSSSPSDWPAPATDGDSVSASSSSMYDHELSTYGTLKTDEMSFERLSSRDDEKCFERLGEKEAENENDIDEISRPEPKFQPLQKCYARDKDGVMYAAVVRRRMYGPQYHRQVEMGLVTSKEEAAELLRNVDEPMWHYFVHYSKWNVNFDRWIPEECVFEVSDDVKAFADRLLQEHKNLQTEMKKVGVKRKKQWQTIDGAAFLREWKKRMTQVEREMKFGKYKGSGASDQGREESAEDQSTEFSAVPTKNAPLHPITSQTGTWTKASLAMECKLREKSLTTKRPPSQVSSVVLPFALRKALVEQWEIISQCGMIPCLPAPITVRRALEKYLESKNVPLNPPDAPAEQVTKLAMSGDDGEGMAKEAMDIGKDEETEIREQEWRDMADGIAMLFDEALATRLLYREEMAQLRALDSIPEYSAMPFSELYGCEHLLRLFVRLPDMIAGQLDESEARPVIAKVNDFVRFLHKNHASLLTQTYRKLNEAELKEQQKLFKTEERKRKNRQAADRVSDEPAAKKNRANESSQ